MNTLQDIADVGIQGPVLGDTIIFTGKAWINANPNESLENEIQFFFPQKTGVVPGLAQSLFVEGRVIPMVIAK